MRFQFLRLQIARETVFGLEQRNIFLQVRAMLLSFTPWLAWMPNSILLTKFRKGLRRPMVSSAL